jgi:hypothetical protein
MPARQFCARIRRRGTNPLSGYGLVRADSVAAALEIAKGLPSPRITLIP